MLADAIRRAVMAAPRVELPNVSAQLWKAYAAGQVTEAEASELSELIEARKVLPPVAQPQRQRVGSRPRTPESVERRRKWAASGRLPPGIACRFTLAEAAVLAVVAVEVAKKGQCTLTVGHLAALAGVSESTARNALREAEALGLVSIDRRRRTAWMSYPNTVQIASKEWASWLRLHGCKSVKPTTQGYKKQASVSPVGTVARAAEGQGGRAVGASAWPPRPLRRPRTAIPGQDGA